MANWRSSKVHQIKWSGVAWASTRAKMSWGVGTRTAARSSNGASLARRPKDAESLASALSASRGAALQCWLRSAGLQLRSPGTAARWAGRDTMAAGLAGTLLSRSLRVTSVCVCARARVCVRVCV